MLGKVVASTAASPRAARRVARPFLNPFVRALLRPLDPLTPRRPAHRAGMYSVASRAPLSIARARALRLMSSPALAPFVRLDVRAGGVAVVTLDAAGEKVNTLSERMMRDLDPVLTRLAAEDAVTGVVVISAKENDFVAGADISMIDRASTAAELAALSRAGQAIMDRVAAIAARKPVVAAIHGSCLGGGLELALACSYRVATSGAKTRLGLPEVKLGLLPGAGGSQRLPRLVGLQESLTLMTTGAFLKPARALKLGLVDAVVEPAALESAALHAARELVAGRLKRAPAALGPCSGCSSARPSAGTFSSRPRTRPRSPRRAASTPPCPRSSTSFARAPTAASQRASRPRPRPSGASAGRPSPRRCAASSSPTRRQSAPSPRSARPRPSARSPCSARA